MILLYIFTYCCFTAIALTFILAVIGFINIILSFIADTIKDKIIESKKDLELRNNMLSDLYFIRDIGVGISSVSIVAIILVDYDNILQLFLLFYVGLQFKNKGRALIKYYFKVFEEIDEPTPLDNLKRELATTKQKS